METRILKPTVENIRRCGEALRKGDLVAMPTETVYGLAGDAFNEDALAKIFAAKERPTFDPLIVHVALDLTPGAPSPVEQLVRLNIVAKEFGTPDTARATDADPFHQARKTVHTLLTRFWPGPLTVVLPKSPAIPDLATSGLPTVAIRMPSHPVARALIAAAERPLAAPSANRFGRISPTSALHVAEELEGRIGSILDGGECEVGLESTVVSVTSTGEATLLRPGGTPVTAIEKATKTRVITAVLKAPAGLKAPGASPGMLESHYAPAKRLVMLPSSVKAMTPAQWADVERRIHADARPAAPIGLLVQSGQAENGARLFSERTSRRCVARTLSREGDLGEAARRLFAVMRELDHSEAELLFAEPCLTDEGLGHAIADRLRRASAGK